MTADKKKKKAKPPVEQTAIDPGKTNPEWANGLRQLYDSVVDEPLPDSFKDLLSELDKKS